MINSDIADGVHVRQSSGNRTGGGWYTITARRGKRASMSLHVKLGSADEAWAVGLAAYDTLKETAEVLHG